MRKRISLRWRLIFSSWSLALVLGGFITLLLHLGNQRQLREQLDKTLEAKCDEVITVLESRALFSTIEQFFVVETVYRFSPYRYFYQITDAEGRIRALSENLGDRALPIPESWTRGKLGTAVHFESEEHPLTPGERVRVRSERVDLRINGDKPETLLIQTAGSLEPIEIAARNTLFYALTVSAGVLAIVFFLLWFVTTRSLEPVATMTRKASQITATNVRERLPLTGNGDELDDLANVLNEMLDRLTSSLGQIEQFSSDAAHQLRTPLTRIRGELDLMLRSAASEPLKSELESIQEEVDRLAQLCSRLLFLARLDQHSEEKSATGRVWVTFHDLVDVDDIVSELLEQLSPLARESGVNLERGATARTFVRGNRSLLVEALLNLLNNAIDVSHDGGSVIVSVDAVGNEVRVSIEDSGPGVPPGERERIFERFYRIPRTPEEAKGSGLGLAIVRSIAEAHQGRVEIADGHGERRGSVFRLVLPRFGS